MIRFKIRSIASPSMDLSSFTKKSGKTYKMPQVKSCIVCKKAIAIDDTPRHLFYSGFCSEEHKNKYMGQ